MSIGQPSPQGIAALYRGNPGALDARIKQEQQAKPGMPPDLAKLMALSINVNEEDAAKRQEALAALQGMPQATTGKPPTVAESLQQLALQKAKQMAVQQQRQQQGLQALMGQAAPAQVPERPPQPERQGSIDELQSNLGNEYAGGGIVAFNGEDDSDVKDKKKLRPYPLSEQGAAWVARQQAERDARAAQESPENIARREAMISQIPTGGLTAPESNRRGEDSELSRNISNTLAAMPGASVTRAPNVLRTVLPALAALLSKDKTEPSAETPAVQQTRAPAMDNRAMLNAADAGLRSLPAAASVPTVTQRPRPTGPATQVEPAAPAAPAEKSLYDKFLEANLNRDPTKVRADALARRKAELGDLDTSAQEAYIKSLQSRLGGLDEPTDTYERVRAHLRRLANAGGRTSIETGAKASAALQDERKAADMQRAALLKEIMGESTKVVDLKRGEKEKAFTFGEKEYEEAYKQAYDAAKETGLNVRERERFAHQAAENKLNRANQLAAASIRTEGAGGKNEDKQRLAELKSLQTSLKDQLKDPRMIGKGGDDLRRQLAAVNAAVAQMANLDTIGAAPGAASPGGTTRMRFDAQGNLVK